MNTDGMSRWELERLQEVAGVKREHQLEGIAKQAIEMGERMLGQLTMADNLAVVLERMLQGWKVWDDLIDAGDPQATTVQAVLIRYKEVRRARSHGVLPGLPGTDLLAGVDFRQQEHTDQPRAGSGRQRGDRLGDRDVEGGHPGGTQREPALAHDPLHKLPGSQQ